MAIHYHGLPLTPASLLPTLAGKHVCISHATARQSNVDWALQNAQSIMWDNGAFSAHTRGATFDWLDFYLWVQPYLGHPHWAVVPDVIDGNEAMQRQLISTWPFDRALGAPVWHLHESLPWLVELAREWPRVCLGSSRQYWKVGSPVWEDRMDEAFDALMILRVLPWVHGLRMLAQLGKRWPLASADSVNVARNAHKGYCPGCKSHKIDIVNGPISWPGSVFA